MPNISADLRDRLLTHMAEANTKLADIKAKQEADSNRLDSHSKRLDATETFIDRWNGGKAVVLGVLVAAGAIGGVVMGVASLLKRGS